MVENSDFMLPTDDPSSYIEGARKTVTCLNPPWLEEIDRDSGFPGSRRIISGLPVTPSFPGT
jgi:hypothetical protein